MEHIGLHLKKIFLKKKQGQLYYQKGSVRKHLYFQEGELVFARTNVPQELIGEVLFGLGKISNEVYNKIDEFIIPKRSIGEVLIENDLISKADLNEGLKYQLREITLNIFSAFDGDFKFRMAEEFSEEAFDVSVPIPVLIEQGVRRMKYASQLKQYLQETVPVLKDRAFFLHLTEDEKEVYHTINGTSSAQNLFDANKFGESPFWKALYLFFCLDLIDLTGELGTVAAGAEKEFTEKEADVVDEKVREVLAMFERLPSLDYYQILEVNKESTAADVKKAYFQMARKYHPDLFDRDLSSDVRNKIDDVFDFITKGYHVLSDEDKRQDYNKKLEKAPIHDRKDGDKRAEVKFRQGKTLYDQTRWEEAQVLLQEAIRLDPYKSSYFLLLAMTQSKMREYHEKAVMNFKKAIELSPWQPDGYLGLGILYKREGMKVMAAKYLKKALQCDPDYHAARKELDSLDPSPKKRGLKDVFSMDTQELKGLFKKDIFKKK